MDLKAYCPEVKSPKAYTAMAVNSSSQAPAATLGPGYSGTPALRMTATVHWGENILDLVSENLSLNDSSVGY